MINDQIVKSRRTLHRNPTPVDYGITLEKAAPEAAPAEGIESQHQAGRSEEITRQFQPGPADDKQNQRQGSLNQPREKLDRPQGNLDPAWTQTPGSSPGSSNTANQKEVQKGIQREKEKEMQKELQRNLQKDKRKAKKENKHPALSFLIKACLALCVLYLIYNILVAANILHRSSGTGTSSSSGSGSDSGSGFIDATSTQGDDAEDSGSGDDAGGLAQGTSYTGDETDNGETGNGEADGGEAETGGQSGGLLQDSSNNTGSAHNTQSDSPDAAYTDIVRTYASYLEQDSKAFLDAYDAGQYGSSSTAVSGSDINYELIASYFTIPEYTEMHYAVRDYNEDGTPELVILLSSDGGSYPQIWAGYTFDGTRVVPLFTGECRLGYRIDLYTLPDNAFLIHGGGGALMGDDTICRIADDRSGLVVEDTYVYDEQANGSRDHIGIHQTLTDEEFQTRYYDGMVSAADGLSLQSVSSGASVTTQ